MHEFQDFCHFFSQKKLSILSIGRFYRLNRLNDKEAQIEKKNAFHRLDLAALPAEEKVPTDGNR